MRISRINSGEAPEAVRPLYEAMYQARGNVPNMFRTAAHRPELLRTMVAHFRCVMETGTVEPGLKELLAVRVSQINDCDY
ncbi:MAG: carboxymuconolactone decarboxylase family protein [Terriglobales bacterium]